MGVQKNSPVFSWWKDGITRGLKSIVQFYLYCVLEKMSNALGSYCGEVGVVCYF